jgi:hypothetical protein
MVPPSESGAALAAEPVVQSDADGIDVFCARTRYGASPDVFQLGAPVWGEPTLHPETCGHAGTNLRIRTIWQAEGSARGHPAQNRAPRAPIQRRDAERAIEEPIVSSVTNPRPRGK